MSRADARRNWVVRGSWIATLFVAACAAALWLWYSNVDPVVTIPSTLLPSPNGYDYYASAAHSMVDVSGVTYASKNRHSTRNPMDRAYTLAEKEALLAKNAEVLRKIREGLRLPCTRPPYRVETQVKQGIEAMSAIRGLAFLLRLEAQVRAARGDWAGACESRLDCIQIGLDMARGGELLDMLSGAVPEDVGRHGFSRILDHLDGPQARAAAQRMAALVAGRTPYADLVREDKWTDQAQMLAAMRKAHWRRGALPSGAKPWDKAIAVGRLAFESRRRAMGEYTRYMDEVIACEERPYALRSPLPPSPRDAYNKGHTGVDLSELYRGAGLIDTDQQTQNTLFAVTLALRAYRVEHGVYPAKLTDLVPGYFGRLPEDPFAQHGPLQYKRTGGGCLLYSVGPDGRDDGGSAIHWPYEATSKGDVVLE
jgi:hypothetical protein